jgi:phosphinothricin acetyltransferase
MLSFGAMTGGDRAGASGARIAGGGRRTRIRAATADDLQAVNDIYNHEVLHGVATFDTVPWALEARSAWFAQHGGGRHAVLVAVEDGRVTGWAGLSSWSERCAYARAAEVSVYVHPERRGRGTGRALLAELIAQGRRAGLGVLLARIESSGRVSLALHRAHGFRAVGTMHGVGEKFGRILDVELLELPLDGGTGS